MGASNLRPISGKNRGPVETSNKSGLPRNIFGEKHTFEVLLCGCDMETPI